MIVDDGSEKNVDQTRTGVRTLLCDDVEGYLATLEHTFLTEDPEWRIAAVNVSPLPRLEALLDSVVQSLAEVVLTLWPDWYGTEQEILPGDSRRPNGRSH